jgi:DNA replication protein DnaC
MELKDIPSTFHVSNISRQHWQSHLSNFENRYDSYNPAFYKKVTELTNTILDMSMDKLPRYIMVVGRPGCGKTHWMVGMFRALVKKIGYADANGASYIEYREMISEIIGGFAERVALRVQLEAWLRPSIMFLDDVSAGRRTFEDGKIEQTLLQEIIINRYEYKKTLVMSMNVEKADLIANFNRLFGEYISSRLSDVLVLEFPRIDFRKRK